MMTNEEIRNIVLLELISEPIGDDGKPTRTPMMPKKEQDEVKERYFADASLRDWDYIFQPIKDDNLRTKTIELFKTLDNEDPGA